MERYDLARKLILAAGERLRREQQKDDGVRQKDGHQDLVTRCDKETEQFLRQGILEHFPGDLVVGEEFDQAGAGESPVVWYIDPIDGTTNFINERRNYAVSVGCFAAGRPDFGLVFDVFSEELYSARAGQGAYRNQTRLKTTDRCDLNEMLMFTPGILHSFLLPHPGQEMLVRLAKELRGVRSRGSVALELCAVAAGEADVFVTVRSSPWDHNAARLILTEAGGHICMLDGSVLPANEKATVLAANSAGTVARILDIYNHYSDY